MSSPVHLCTYGSGSRKYKFVKHQFFNHTKKRNKSLPAVNMYHSTSKTKKGRKKESERRLNILKKGGKKEEEK